MGRSKTKEIAEVYNLFLFSGSLSNSFYAFSLRAANKLKKQTVSTVCTRFAKYERLKTI